MTSIPKRGVLLIGAALLIAGSYMTWISVDLGFTSFSSTGTETTEGKLTAIAGLVLVIVGLTLTRSGAVGRWSSLVGLAAAGFGGIVLLLEYLDVRERIAEADGSAAVATVGMGIWVTAAGALLAFAAATWALAAQRQSAA